MGQLKTLGSSYGLKMILDPKDLINDVINGDWDTSSLELKQHNIPKAANALEWMIEPKFCFSFVPWPRQVEILTKLFEDYCPDCSDMSVVNDMWGMSLHHIRSKVTYLQHGKCLECGKNRRDFRNEGKHQGVYELIGVAGQRCLAPETKVVLANGNVISLQEVQVDDLLMDQNGLCKVLKKETSIQAGYFKIVIGNPEFLSKPEIFVCGDEHLWITKNGVKVTTELTENDSIKYQEGWGQVLGISKEKRKTRLIDIETCTGTFLHPSKLVLHNSGKTALTAKITAYLAHQYLCLDGVCSNHFGLPGTLLTGTFVAADVKQVKDTTWGDFRSTIKDSEWFKDYFSYLDSEKKRLGVKLYESKDTSLEFPLKRLKFEFGAGSMAGLRGRTRIFGSIDELGWFEQNQSAKQRSGPEIYTALSNSLRTVRSKSNAAFKQGRYNLPSAFMLNVSSPKAEDDPIMTKFAAAKADPKTYCFHFATWDINPELDKAEMKSEMIKDPIKTMRDFGAQPGSGRDIFLPNVEIMHANIDDTRHNAIQYRPAIFEQVIKENKYYYAKADFQGLTLDSSYPYVIACDAGEVKNGYSIVIARLGENSHTQIQAVVSIQPKPLDQGTIATVHFPSVTEIIREIGKLIHIEMIVYDRWQSTQALHEFRDMGYEAKQVSLKYTDFNEFKKRFLENMIQYPSSEVPFQTLMLEDVSDLTPVAMLLKQTRTVRDTGKQVIKPNNGDDDIFRGTVLADYILHAFESRFRKVEFGSKWSGKSGLFLVRHSQNTVYNRSPLKPKEDSGKGNFITVRKRSS